GWADLRSGETLLAERPVAARAAGGAFRRGSAQVGLQSGLPDADRAPCAGPGGDLQPDRAAGGVLLLRRAESGCRAVRAQETVARPGAPGHATGAVEARSPASVEQGRHYRGDPGGGRVHGPQAARPDAADVPGHHRPGQLGVGAGRHGHPRSGPHPLPPASGHRAARRRVEEGEQGVGKAAGGHRLIGATDLRGRLHAGLFINAVRESSRMFEIQPMSPEQYRQQTRSITLAILTLFVLLALTSATLAVKLFGEPGGNNFRWNLAGVLTGLAATVAIVRLKFWSTPWMAPAVYGWRLKRSLMRVTNQMHQVQAGVAAGDPEAMKLLRFYHLGLTQM